MFFDAKINLASALSLCSVVVGMTIYAGTDYGFNAEGYFWLVVNSAATITSTIWNRVYVKKVTAGDIQTPNGVTFIVQSETIPIALFLAAKNNEYGAYAELLKLPSGPLAVIVLTCFGGIAIGMVRNPTRRQYPAISPKLRRVTVRELVLDWLRSL